MTELPEPLRPLEDYPQFILWTIADRNGTKVKLPVDYRTGQVTDAHDPAVWMDAKTAFLYAGNSYGVGFVFTKDDPFFFLDIDSCLEGNAWSALSEQLIGALPAAAVEISQSGRGLHVFGAYTSVPKHASKNTELHLELYTAGRFVALTFDRMSGSIATDCTAPLAALASYYFASRADVAPQEWTDKPDSQWAGFDGDEELIAKALETQSAASIFGGKANFQALWEANEDILERSYSDPNRTYDASSADAALAQHLAFWTGNDCTRIWRLMWRSALVRDKWRDREDYVKRIILFATSLQKTFHSTGKIDNTLADAHGAPKLRASSDAQRNFATNVRAQKLAQCGGDEDLIRKLCAPSGANASAKFWLDNRDKTPQELIALITPIESAKNPLGDTNGPEIVSGYQYLGATLQIEHFKGCCYIQDRHVVIDSGGALLKPEQFNATYGGYVFQLDETGDKVTRKAWEAFTESQIVKYPKAASGCFRPELPPGQLIEEEGRRLVNTYVPIQTARLEGDPSPFLNQVKKLVPVLHDQEILLAYMAAIIQHKGFKFQWTPLLQGTEGNGKTLLSRCVAHAVGHRYTHFPRTNELAEKFNAWLFEKLFIGIEEMHVPEHKKEILEILKPMITNTPLAKRGMHQSEVMLDNRANFMLNSNHRDAIHKTRNDRRFCVFFTTQQSADDLKRDGMDGNYFPELYKWLDSGGYAIVARFLDNYVIPDALNPAKDCHRAPITSTTHEAISASRGPAEQEILAAIDEERPGFRSGIISSMEVEKLLQKKGMARLVPRTKRRQMLRNIGYDYHPALNQGRATRPTFLDGGKTHLFVRDDHPLKNLELPSEVMNAYEAAQQKTLSDTVPSPIEVFQGPQP